MAWRTTRRVSTNAPENFDFHTVRDDRGPRVRREAERAVPPRRAGGRGRARRREREGRRPRDGRGQRRARRGDGGRAAAEQGLGLGRARRAARVDGRRVGEGRRHDRVVRARARPRRPAAAAAGRGGAPPVARATPAARPSATTLCAPTQPTTAGASACRRSQTTSVSAGDARTEIVALGDAQGRGERRRRRGASGPPPRKGPVADAPGAGRRPEAPAGRGVRGDEAKAEKEAARVGRELDGVDGRGDRVGQQLERVLRPRRRRARRVVAVARRLGALTLLAHPVFFLRAALLTSFCARRRRV